MRLPPPVLLLALHTLALAQSPPVGPSEGTWKNGNYSLFVPTTWKKEDGGKYTLFLTIPPPSHNAKDYLSLWQSNKGPTPHVAVTVESSIGTGEYKPLIEKVCADYGLDGTRVFVVGYSEGAQRAVTFNNEFPETAAGIILLQGMVQTMDPKPAGKATPYFMMTDKSCSYAPMFEATGFKTELENAGYEATLVELDGPGPEKDGWPVSQMSKVFEWALGVRPYRFEELFDSVAVALKPESKPEEWRTRLREDVKRYLRQYGDAVSPGGGKAAEAGVATALRDAVPFARELKGGLKGTIAIVGAAKGKKIEGGALVICESGEFDSIEEGVVIATGDVKAGKVSKSLVIARGAVTIAKDAMSSFLHVGGRLKVGTAMEDCTVLALGGAEAAGKAKNNWFINTSDLKIKSNEAARPFKKARLPGGK